MKAVIFDTETTGLIDNHLLKLDKQPEVIEFYACTVDLETGELSWQVDLLIKPKRAIDDEITKITGITQDMVKDAPPFAECAPVIRQILESERYVIAHNLSYDIEIIDMEFERVGAQKVAWPRLLCTVEQTIHLKGFRLGLSQLHEHLFGEAFAGSHRAKVDVQALVRCCVELYKRDLL